MRATLIGLSSLLIITLAVTDDGHLDKPPLADNLDYLQKGLLESLHPKNSSYTKWSPHWIPADCKSLTEDNNMSAIDVEAFSVRYPDCPQDPWVLCRHKDSPDPLSNMIDLFGRVPVGARQWVRHIINLPDPNNTYAYNVGGNIAMFDRINGDLTVFIHETGHSLDLFGAYPDNPLSSSKNWLESYARDTHVPDPYSQTDQFENVAQNTVVAAYDLNVPGGIQGVEPKWHGLRNQLRTLEGEQSLNEGFLLSGGVCNKRLENSKAVRVDGQSKNRIARGLAEQPPDVGLSGSVDVIEPVDFDTRDGCGRCGS